MCYDIVTINYITFSVLLVPTNFVVAKTVSSYHYKFNQKMKNFNSQILIVVKHIYSTVNIIPMDKLDKLYDIVKK